MAGHDHILRSGAHQIAVRDWGGDGKPVVLLPGGGRNLADWEPVVADLVDHHRVVGVDLPGHGASSEPDRWEWEVAIDFVECAIDALGLDNPFVVGHSMGGMVAARYGLAHPDCPGVVNVDGHGLGGPSVPAVFHEERARLLREAPPPPPDWGDDAWLDAQVEAFRPGVEALGLDWEAAVPAIRRSYARTDEGKWQRRPSTAFMDTLPKDMGPELYDIYRVVKCPLLVFNCTRKQAAPFSTEVAAAYRQSIAGDLDALRADCPNVEVVSIDTGHMVLLEAPRETARHLLSFTST